ncbi:MAG: DUF2914 domain-containing protein [Myxococcota bacterium]
MRLDGRESGGRLAPLALGLVAMIALVLWWTADDEPTPVESGAALAMVGDRPAASAMDRAMDGAGQDPLDPLDPSERLGATPKPMVQPTARSGPAGAPTFAEPVEDVAPPPPPPRIDRKPPPGTPERHALALKKLPHSTYDRAPLGGIGPEGLHVDRITMGTGYDSGACTGPVGKFSLKTEKVANVCFRAVHLRKTQRVIVLWEHEGKVLRRTFVKIGPTHGYRTRAGLSLRRRPKGNWKARVMSADGVELASHAFQIL